MGVSPPHFLLIIYYPYDVYARCTILKVCPYVHTCISPLPTSLYCYIDQHRPLANSTGSVKPCVNSALLLSILSSWLHILITTLWGHTYNLYQLPRDLCLFVVIFNIFFLHATFQIRISNFKQLVVAFEFKNSPHYFSSLCFRIMSFSRYFAYLSQEKVIPANLHVCI